MEPGLIVAPSVPLAGLLPLTLLVVAALVILLVDAFLPRTNGHGAAIGAAALAVCLGITLRFLGSRPPDPFPGMFATDDFGHFFDIIFYLAALAALGLSMRWHIGLKRGEYHALLLLATAGMVSLAHATSLVSIFLGLELLSIVLYVLTGFLPGRANGIEAAIKYFFLGAFSSGFLLYGIALIYGTTGAFELAAINERLLTLTSDGAAVPPLLVIGSAFVLVGFAFKISSVPFHMWTPDVYEGAPTPVGAFMSVGTKAAAFAAMLRVFTTALGPISVDWRPVVAGIAVATMLVGNLVGLTQRNLKRLLAFSSIAHAGYALVGLVAWEAGGRAAVIFYLFVYAFMNLGAFGVLAALERDGEGLHLSDLAGLAKRRPLAAAAMALFLLSLAGVPPLAGFMGKFNLFLAAVEAGWIKLAVLGVVYSAIAAYYYLRVIVVMYMQAVPAREERLASIAWPAAVVLGVAALGVVFLGVAPGSVLELLDGVVRGL